MAEAPLAEIYWLGWTIRLFVYYSCNLSTFHHVDIHYKNCLLFPTIYEFTFYLYSFYYPTFYKFTFISTLSTLTPHGLVASSRMFSIRWQIISLSDKISASVWTKNRVSFKYKTTFDLYFVHNSAWEFYK